MARRELSLSRACLGPGCRRGCAVRYPCMTCSTRAAQATNSGNPSGVCSKQALRRGGELRLTASKAQNPDTRRTADFDHRQSISESHCGIRETSTRKCTGVVRNQARSATTQHSSPRRRARTPLAALSRSCVSQCATK